jgi:PEP-CTERM motif-containing protein
MDTKKALLGALLLAAMAAVPSEAIVITIGDNDGYGFGVADGAPVPSFAFDNRSLVEATATDGRQYTDFAPSAFNDVLGATPFDVIFPLSSALASGTFQMDVQGIQLGITKLSFNGILQGPVISFSGPQGAFGSGIVNIPLSATVLSAVNTDGFFKLTISGNNNPGNRDIIAFDYFSLDAQPVPEPASLLLLGSGVSALALRRRRS